MAGLHMLYDIAAPSVQHAAQHKAAYAPTFTVAQCYMCSLDCPAACANHMLGAGACCHGSYLLIHDLLELHVYSRRRCRQQANF